MRLNNNNNSGPLVSRYSLLLQMPPRASAATAGRVEEEDEWSESECSCEVSVKGTSSSSCGSINEEEEDGKQSSRRVRFAAEETNLSHETDIVYSVEEQAACWYSKAWRSENKKTHSEFTEHLRAQAEEKINQMSDDDETESCSFVHIMTSLYQSCQRGELVRELPAGDLLADETWGMERAILPIYHRDKLARRCSLVETLNELQEELQLLPPEDVQEALACSAREYSRPATLFARLLGLLAEQQVCS